MRRLLVPSALVAVAALVATSCGTLNDGVAASVNGRDITWDTVEELLGDPQFMPFLADEFAEGLGLDGEVEAISSEAATASGDVVRDVVGVTLLFERVEYELDRDDAGTTEADREVAVEGDDETGFEGLAASEGWDELEAASKDYFTRLQATILALSRSASALSQSPEAADVAAAALVRRYPDIASEQSGPDGADQICVDVLQVGSAEAEVVDVALAGGATLAEVADELGVAAFIEEEVCVDAADIALFPEVVALDVGETAGPLAVPDDPTLALYFTAVEGPEPASAASAAAEALVASIVSGDIVTWFVFLGEHAEVSVDPRLGTGAQPNPDNGVFVITPPPRSSAAAPAADAPAGS